MRAISSCLPAPCETLTRRKVFEESLDRTYKDFLSKVALGRGAAVLKARADLVEKNIQLQRSSANVVNFCGLEQLASIGLVRFPALPCACVSIKLAEGEARPRAAAQGGSVSSLRAESLQSK